MCLLPRLVGMLILFLACLTTVHGQELELIPSLSLSERYDDNIFLDPDGAEDDFITIISPGIRLRYVPRRDTQLTFDYRADFEIFANNTNQNAITQRGVFNFASQLTSRLSLTLRDRFLITEEPTARSADVGDPTGLRSVSQEERRRTIRNNARGAFDLRLARRFTLGLLFESLIDDVDTASELDERRFSTGLTLGYLTHIDRQSQVHLTYLATFHLFNENGATNESAADFLVHLVAVGFRHALTPTLSGRAAIGVTVTDTDAPDTALLTAVIGNIGVTKTLRTGELTLDYARRVTSGEGEGGVLIADTFSGALAVKATPKVTLALGNTLSFFDFRRAAALSGGDRLFWSIRPRITYQILAPLSLSVLYTYESTHFAGNDPNFDFADREDHRLDFSARYALRDWLSVGFTYRYSQRRFANQRTFRGADPFERNQFMLTLTAAPNLRF